MLQEKEMGYALFSEPSPPGHLSAEAALPPLPALRRLSLCVAIAIFVCSASGIVLGSAFSLLTLSSFCCQATLAIAALGVAALEAPRPPSTSPLEEPGGDDLTLYGRQSASLLERGAVACLVGVFGVWHFWVNVASGLLCFLLTFLGLFEVSVHFLGGGEAEALRVLRRGSALAQGAMLNGRPAWGSFSPGLPWAPGIVSQKGDSTHSLGREGLLLQQRQQQQQPLLQQQQKKQQPLLPHLPEAAAECASAPIRYPDSPSDFQQQQQQQSLQQQQQSLQQQQELLMPGSKPLERSLTEGPSNAVVGV